MTDDFALKPIAEIAARLALAGEEISSYGKFCAKIVSRSWTLRPNSKSKVILVTGTSPTPHGEGKTVTAIGLSMALNRLGHLAVVCSRQPSLGPLFGVKGGAAGGGNSRLEPLDTINMGLTGDFNMISHAHNLLAAMVDNHIFQGNNAPVIDPARVIWPRTIDMNDRVLRQIKIGFSEKKAGVQRDDGFIITAASEVMTTLCLSQNFANLKERLARIIIGYTANGKPVVSDDVRAAGAMGALLRDAMLPNLVQTCEGTPALVHGGPFGNIATGTCSLVSIYTSLNHADYTVVEAGFGSDLGAEKFFDIVCRAGDFNVDTAVIVTTIRALRHHGSIFEGTAEFQLTKGLENLEKHIQNILMFGAKPIVAINRFEEDSDADIRTVAEFCSGMNIPQAVSRVFEDGSKGAIELATLVVEATQLPSKTHPIYELHESVEEKVRKIATSVYGAKDVNYQPRAIEDLQQISELGLTNYPICIAKTPLSLSDDPKKLCRPTDFTVKVDRIDIAAGPGFHVVRMGNIMMMPGLPPRPQAESFDLTDDGRIVGIF